MSSAGRRIVLTEGTSYWVARDVETGVSSQGETRELALENLDEALEGYEGAGDPPSDEELEAIGIDPSSNRPGSLDESEIFNNRPDDQRDVFRLRGR